jgi:hypothetical protein
MEKAMKRVVFYKTKWSKEKPPFVCRLADKPHHPKVRVWMETPAGFSPIPYKEIGKLMYETREGEFETLAERTAEKITAEIAKRTRDQRQKGEIRVTVRVREGRDFWVEAVEEEKVE